MINCQSRETLTILEELLIFREEALQAKTKAAQQQTARANAAAAQQQPQGLITLDCNMQVRRNYKIIAV